MVETTSISLDLNAEERELRKRLVFPYQWHGRQTDDADRATAFIYDCVTFAALEQAIAQRLAHHPDYERLRHYALNRWFNFRSARGVEALFCAHPCVTPAPLYERTWDFAIDGLQFDHKTTVYPRSYPIPVYEAVTTPWHLIAWLYQQQSQQQRCHWHNRLFLVLHAADGEHWKLRAHLRMLKAAIDEYVSNFSPDHLTPVWHNGQQEAVADIIWIIEEEWQLRTVALPPMGFPTNQWHGVRGDCAMENRLDDKRDGQPQKGNTMITLTHEQQNALERALHEPVSIITGGPGTGKTTLMKHIIAAFQQEKGLHEIALCAPTGQAAQRLQAATGMKARTVHSLISSIDQGNAAPDIILLDEASMLDLETASRLMDCVEHLAHLIFVGDVDQLPSVGPGMVLADMIRAGIPTTYLTQVQRQGADSYIAQAARALKEGRMPTFAPSIDQGNLWLFEEADQSRIVEIVGRLASDFLPSRGIDPEDILVISPQREGKLITVDNLNQQLQAVLNPPAPDKHEVPWYNRVLREGDRLVWLENNTEWDLVNGSRVTVAELFDYPDLRGRGKKHLRQAWEQHEDAMQVVYGDDYDANQRHVAERFLHQNPGISTTAMVRLDTGQHVVLTDERFAAAHGYCTTVHKAQGSEAKAVIAILHTAFYHNLISRRLVLTAITRGREVSIVVGQEEMIRKALRNDSDGNRRTALVERLT